MASTAHDSTFAPPRTRAGRHRRLRLRLRRSRAPRPTTPPALPAWIAWPAPCWPCSSRPAPSCSGPLVPGTVVPHGARVPGTAYELDPVPGGLQHRRDGPLARLQRHLAGGRVGPPLGQPGRHPRRRRLARHGARCAGGAAPLTVHDVLTAMIKAHEIQGVLALENSFNRVGLDHVLLVKVASTAVAARLLGATRDQVVDAVSHAWIDGQALRTYRHAPNTGSRKSLGGRRRRGRGVRLALMAMAGRDGLSLGAQRAPLGASATCSSRASRSRFQRPFGSYVMENILFKICFPGRVPRPDRRRVRHAAAPAGARPPGRDRARSTIATQESAIRIIDKTGPLYNPADRDHCLQYMIAVP